MSEEQGEAVSEIAAGKEPAPESITQQQENHQQPATAADEKGESAAEPEQQEEGEAGQSVGEEKSEEVTTEREGGGEGVTSEQRREEEGKEGEEANEQRREEEGNEGEEANEQRREEEGKEGEEQRAADEVGVSGGEGRQAPEESAGTAEELAGDGGEEISGGGENEQGGSTSEGGDGEIREGEGGGGEVVEGGGAEDEGEKGESGESEGVKEEDTGEGEQQPEVDGEEVGVVTTVMSPPDSRLVSASKPSPLENITEEEEEEEREEEEPVDREELISACREALMNQRRLRNENTQLQHKIAEYLSHKKAEEKPDPGRNVTDQEKRYLQCMSALEQLEVELHQVQSHWMGREEEMRALCDSKQREVQHEAGEFLKYQWDSASQAVDSRSGRKLTPADISRVQSAQEANDQAVFQARLENIKLTNKIERLETLLKQKEELAEGLHMIDFEQLKISNVDLTEKVEERNEDITKLTGKVRATVEVLTHVKEKLHFLQGENGKKRGHLGLLDSELAKRRDILSRLKQTRDTLRLDNQRLRQRGGLVCHSDLLRDFEDRQDQNAELQSKLERLRAQHSQNSMQCGGLRRKIEHARHLQHHLH